MIVRIVMMTGKGHDGMTIIMTMGRDEPRGKEWWAKANWVSSGIQVMLSLFLRLFTMLLLLFTCWNHRNWNTSDLLPILSPRKPFKVFPSEATSESLIVTLNYFALFKEVLPCMFVISAPSGKHFNLRVGFIIGESGRENQTLKYIGWKYFTRFQYFWSRLQSNQTLRNWAYMQKTWWFNC